MGTLLGMSCHRTFITFVIAYIGTVFSLQWSNKQVPDPFLYLKDMGLMFRRSEDVCKICIGANNCVDIEEDKCNYYMATAAILQDDTIQPVPLATTNIPSAKSHVDDMLYDLADAVNNQNEYKDCIPYVSKYTNCNKENVCLGCKTCDCDAFGRWNCTLTQTCRKETLKMALDHRSLLVVLDNLRKEDINTNRVKRQIEKLSTPNLKHEEIQSLLSEWIYGVPPNLDEPKDELADVSDETNEEESKNTTEKILKFIFHDPLYEVHDRASEFDGTNNKVKRSIDESTNVNTDSNKDKFFNMKSSDMQVDLKETDLTDWLSNENFLLGENSDDVKYNNYEIRNINLSEKANNSDINKSDLNNVVSKMKSFAAQYNKKYEAIQEIRDKHHVNYNKPEHSPFMDMSVLNDFIAKVFQNTTNETGLFSYINKDNVNSNENTLENKKLEPVKAGINQDFSIEKPDKTSINKMKRSIDSYVTNLNQINVKTDFNENYYEDKNVGSKNNLKELNNEEIKEWLNEQHPLNLISNDTSITSTSKDGNFTTDGINTLNDIVNNSNENNGYTRKNLLLNLRNAETETFDSTQMKKISDDYMYDDDNVTYEDEFVEEKLYNFTGFEVSTVQPEYWTTTEAIETAVTEIVFDLLESAKNRYRQEGESKANNTNSTPNIIEPVLEKNARIIDNVIMKRDVSNVNEDNTEESKTVHYTNVADNPKSASNISDTIKDLIHDVLLPLNNIINDKQKELNELIRMKTGLVKFIKSSKNYDPTSNINFNFNNSQTNANVSHDRNSYFSIYKLEIVPNFNLDQYETNTSMIDRYMNKLKHDVYEVIRDIVGIQKMHSDPLKVPKDIRFLVNAMKQYVHKKGFHIKTPNKNDTILRRNMKTVEYNLHKPNIKEMIIKIIEFLDKDMPSENVLVGLSPTAKTVLQRIFKTYYTDDFAIMGLRVHDPHYNLTNDLNNIGTKWDEMTKNLHTCSPTSTLYKMQTLHQIISNDVSKMADALSLLDFARSRRMMPIDEHVGEGIMTRITKDLQNILMKLEPYSQQEKEKKMQLEGPQFVLANPKQRKNKLSFLTKLKKMLVNSKKDILSLIHKKVPNSDIVRELAKKRLNKVTEQRLSNYQDTMTRWQEQLNVIPLRHKRSANTEKFHRRMNNILPKYLRGKVPTNKTNPLSSVRTKIRDKLKPVRESNTMADVKKIAPSPEKIRLNGTITKTTAKPSVYAEPKPITMVVPQKKGVKTQRHQKTLKKFLKKSTKKAWNSKKVTSKP